MNVLEAAHHIASFLGQRGVPYVVIGGLAVQQWGEPRFTRDVDLVVMVPEDALEAFVQAVIDVFPARTEDPVAFARQNRVLLVATDDGVPIDISLGLPGYEEEVMRRGVTVTLAGLGPVRFISAEDLIIHKCVAGRARDREDVERILDRGGQTVDREYIRSWLAEFAPLIDEHDVVDVFEEALRRKR